MQRIHALELCSSSEILISLKHTSNCGYIYVIMLLYYGLLSLFRICKPNHLTHLYLYIALAVRWPNGIPTSCRNRDVTAMYYLWCEHIINKTYMYIVSFLVTKILILSICLSHIYYLCIHTRIDGEGFIKVADFGLSKSMYEKCYFRQARDDELKLPIKWMALESVENDIFTEKTDVVR